MSRFAFAGGHNMSTLLVTVMLMNAISTIIAFRLLQRQVSTWVARLSGVQMCSVFDCQTAYRLPPVFAGNTVTRKLLSPLFSAHYSFGSKGAVRVPTSKHVQWWVACVRRNSSLQPTAAALPDISAAAWRPPTDTNQSDQLHQRGPSLLLLSPIRRWPGLQW